MAWKRVLIGILGSIALAQAASAQQKPDKVVIGYLNLVNAQLVAKALRLHEKDLGVPVEWVKFGSGGDVNRAVAAARLARVAIGSSRSIWSRRAIASTRSRSFSTWTSPSNWTRPVLSMTASTV